MLSYIRLLCCLPCQPKFSATKKSNLSTLRDLSLFVNKLDENEQLAVNSVIHRILMELSTIPSRHPNGVAPFDPLLNPNALNSLLETLRPHTTHASPRGTLESTANESMSSVGWSLPPVADRRPSITSTHSANGRSSLPNPYDVHTYFTRPQLELLLQLDCVRHFRQYAVMSNLGCDTFLELPDLLPLPCTDSEGGRLRVASWNLNRFTVAKARHPGFREAICLTILRARISLILLQEVASVDVANLLCAELNSPTLPHVRQWVSCHASSSVPLWDMVSSLQPTGAMFRGKEYAIFLFNKHSGIRIRRTGLLESQNMAQAEKHFSRSPCYAVCHLRSFRVVFVSVHLKSRGLRNSTAMRTAAEAELLETVVRAFYDTQPDGSHLIIAGDFNLHSGHEAFHGLKELGFRSVLCATQATTTSALALSDQPGTCTTAYDNAWLSSSLTQFGNLQLSTDLAYTGDSGVISRDLRHPLIPDSTGAGANGFISDHCPIWFDLLVP